MQVAINERSSVSGVDMLIVRLVLLIVETLSLMCCTVRLVLLIVETLSLMCCTVRLVLLIVETLSLMLRESEVFASRMACLKTDDGAVVSQLITLLVRRPVIHDHVTGTEQVLALICHLL